MTELGLDPRSWNQRVVATYRAPGDGPGAADGVSLLLLTTQGRRTGKPHTTPVVALREGSRYLVAVSDGGAASEPDWYRNLLAHPQVTIERPGESGEVEPWAAVAVPIDGPEGGVVALVPLDPEELAARPELRQGLGDALLTCHATLRAQLAEVRSAIAAALAEPAPAAGEALRRCALTYCYGLQVHHLREDGAFSPLARHLPELAPVLDRLRGEHERLEGALRAFEVLLDAGPPRDRAGVEAVRRALDAVQAGLDEHFTTEEEHLLPALGVARPDPGP
ncbi:MAG TPA: nitroreductase/quinone reductase family protein [Acidimicrobiales bacterium]